MPEDRELARALAAIAHPVTGSPSDFDPILDLVGEAALVLLGEATHGTHEFYRARAEITRRLIEEKGFGAVVAEADWPDAWRVNAYLQGADADGDSEEALGSFRRFPTWMWRNADVLDLVGGLREWNEARPAREKAAFLGMDLYSLHASMESVLRYLDRVDPPAARRARERYACFDHFGSDVQSYGYAAGLGLSESCEREVVAQLVDLSRRAADYARRDGLLARDDFFQAEQNARLVRNAEEYYRSMFGGRASSWNLRDTHMVESLEAIRAHLRSTGRSDKVAVWAHNSHLGDARATSMGAEGELNVGQLVRERHGRAAVLVGFTTYEGTVTAADDWDGPAERKTVRPGLAGSWESALHAVGLDGFSIVLRDRAWPALRAPRLERAIGVVYRPRTERVSHYFEARMGDQFDAVIHFDRTRAVEPLERRGAAGREPPETYPTGV